MLLGRWALVSEDLSGLDLRLEELTGRDAELTATLHRDEAELAEGRQSLDQLATELAERHEEQAQLAATIEGRQEFLKGARQRSDEFVERLQTGRNQADERRRESSDFRHSLGNLDERSAELLEGARPGGTGGGRRRPEDRRLPAAGRRRRRRPGNAGRQAQDRDRRG